MPTGLVCCAAAIQQKEKLPGSCAQVSRPGAQIRAETQYQHRVQQDVLVETSLQEPHLSIGAPNQIGPSFSAALSRVGSGTWPCFYLIHLEEVPFCNDLNKVRGKGRWLSYAYVRCGLHPLRHILERLMWVLL